MPMIQLTIVTYVMLTVRQIATFLLISTAPFVITTIAHPMPSIFGINRQRRTPHKVNPTSPSQAEGEPRQSSQTQQGSGTYVSLRFCPSQPFVRSSAYCSPFSRK